MRVHFGPLPHRRSRNRSIYDWVWESRMPTVPSGCWSIPLHSHEVQSWGSRGPWHTEPPRRTAWSNWQFSKALPSKAGTLGLWPKRRKIIPFHWHSFPLSCAAMCRPPEEGVRETPSWVCMTSSRFQYSDLRLWVGSFYGHEVADWEFFLSGRYVLSVLPKATGNLMKMA